MNRGIPLVNLLTSYIKLWSSSLIVSSLIQAGWMSMPTVELPDLPIRILKWGAISEGPYPIFLVNCVVPLVWSFSCHVELSLPFHDWFFIRSLLHELGSLLRIRWLPVWPLNFLTIWLNSGSVWQMDGSIQVIDLVSLPSIDNISSSVSLEEETGWCRSFIIWPLKLSSIRHSSCSVLKMNRGIPLVDLLTSNI